MQSNYFMCRVFHDLDLQGRLLRFDNRKISCDLDQMQIMFTELFWGRLWRRRGQRRLLCLQEIEQRRRGGDAGGGRGEGALLQLPTDGVVHEEVGAGIPVGGIREAGEEEGGKGGNSGFFVVMTRIEIKRMKSSRSISARAATYYRSGFLGLSCCVNLHRRQREKPTTESFILRSFFFIC